MPQDNTFVVPSGRGLNTAVRHRDAAPQECVDGANFDLNTDFAGFRRRKAFDLAGTATNAGQINGFSQLVTASGTITTLVQAGGTVYSWDGASSFTSVGTVNSAARLRGPAHHIWKLNPEVVFITDLAKTENLKTWDGTTFTDATEDLSGALAAKYAMVYQERLFLANVTIGGTASPHLLLASTRGANSTFDSSVRSLETSLLSSPFFLPVSDLAPINGLQPGLRTLVMSTERGNLYQLIGRHAFEYELQEFYEGAGSSGNEALTNIGNDILIGRAGHLDTLSGVERFGDTSVDNVDRWVHPNIEEVNEWTIIYDQRLQKVFCFPKDKSRLFVLHKSVLELQDGGSPWSQWTTDHGVAFQPTAVMALRRPSDGRDVIYMGDATGNIYQMDGDAGQDGGTTDIAAFRETGIIEAEEDKVFDLSGYVDYKRLASSTATLTFKHGGLNVFNQQATVEIPASTEFAVYGDVAGNDAYYNGSTAASGDFYYGGRFQDRISRSTFRVAGQSSFFRLRTEISGANEFEIDQIGINYQSTKD